MAKVFNVVLCQIWSHWYLPRQSLAHASHEASSTSHKMNEIFFPTQLQLGKHFLVSVRKKNFATLRGTP